MLINVIDLNINIIDLNINIIDLNFNIIDLNIKNQITLKYLCARVGGFVYLDTHVCGSECISGQYVEIGFLLPQYVFQS